MTKVQNYETLTTQAKTIVNNNKSVHWNSKQTPYTLLDDSINQTYTGQHHKRRSIGHSIDTPNLDSKNPLFTTTYDDTSTNDPLDTK